MNKMRHGKCGLQNQIVQLNLVIKNKFLIRKILILMKLRLLIIFKLYYRIYFLMIISLSSWLDYQIVNKNIWKM